jgi:adenylate cyclase
LVEIERKFLVVGTPWHEAGTCVEIRQGYLSEGDRATVRVRVAGESASLAVKGPTTGIRRAEFEYAIPFEDGLALLELCPGEAVVKTRHHLRVNDSVWEIDVFSGANAGLVVAELELEHEDQFFDRPPWLGEEVSHDPRYRNSNLSRQPFECWND